jgi:5-dehydro-2-deoxygluconokinase
MASAIDCERVMQPSRPASTAHATPELVCMGRAAVDLYGEQIGGRLEDMQTFAKYLGGSPCNTAVGAARLGLRAAMLTRVGDEHNGRFVRETLAAEGVDVSQVRTDPKRLTALVFLGIRDRDTFPLLFYRDQCADMGLCVDDVDAAFIGSAKALLLSGTHLSQPQTYQACVAAAHAARAAGTRVVLDIDYRPVLWGLTAPGLGEQRYIASDNVSAHLQTVLPLCDLIVGTEEEVHIAGGSPDTATALQHIRALSSALIVMKRGPMGCVAYPGAIPPRLDDGVTGPGFPVEVFNVLGAGDAFMAGLLRGWVRDEPLPQALRYANACGAIVVSRHGCAPAMPSWDELNHFLHHGSPSARLREDPVLEQLHHASTRTRRWPTLAVLAFDHRSQLEELAQRHQLPPARIAQFKQLVALAAEEGYSAACRAAPRARDVPLPGVIIDERHGSDALARLSGRGWWIGRPVERPGSRPLAFEAGEHIGLALRGWPAEHVAKCLVAHHPDDDGALAAEQLQSLLTLAQACRGTGHELLVEVIPPSEMSSDSHTLARALQQIYACGVYPDWWKLPPPADAATWQHIDSTIRQHDPRCRGVLLLGLQASEDRLAQRFRVAANQPLCKGFAVGRSLFADAAEAWFAGTVGDNTVIEQVALRYQRLIEIWCEARASHAAPETASLSRTTP